LKFIDVSKVLAASTIRAMMEAASTCKTSVNFHQTTRLNNPEDSHIPNRTLMNMQVLSL
jgi:hypothetical protein